MSPYNLEWELLHLYGKRYWTMDKFWHWMAFKLPHGLVKWATIRLIAHATQGRYSNQVVPELTAMDALKRWEDSPYAR